MDERFAKARSNLIDVLREGLSSLGKMSAENVKSWMDYRRSIFLATITLLVAVTPFTKDYVTFPKLYWTGYSILLVSVTLGLISEEVRHWMLNRIFEHGKRHTKSAIDALFLAEEAEALKAAHNLFQQAGKIPSHLEIIAGAAMLFSTVAMLAFIAGLMCISLSVSPFVVSALEITVP